MNKHHPELSSDLYKCVKISQLIPGMLECISELEKIDEAFQLSIELKTSKRKFESIAIKDSYTEDEIEDFREHLFEALVALGTGLREPSLKKLDGSKKASLVNVLADIASYQDDINRIASK